MRIPRPFRSLFVGVWLAALTACAALPSTLSTQAPDTIKRSFVDGAYGQVHVRTATPKANMSAKRTLVLLHPTPYSSQFFLPFIEAMDGDRTIIAMDTPGYGDSARPDSVPDIQGYARNALGVLDSINVEGSVDIIGYHTGTLIGIEMALANPARVNKLILPGIPVYAPDKLPELYAKYAKPDNIEEDGSHLTGKWKFATYSMNQGLSLEGVQSHFSDYMQAMPHTTDAYYSVFTYPGYERLPLLNRPALFVAINGSLNQETRAAQSLTPGSELLYLEYVKVGLFDVATEQMAKITRDYLDSK